MSYQALLFCPDEKTARTVTQVLSELDFSVEAVAEPFAVVKKLMAQHFDAIVADCENEQNASLIFKSARNSASNQSSLFVAVVEGQAGVAKAFRIGANLVLTKPINVEQSKGTLRVARGLLRKNADSAKAAAAQTAPSAAQPPQAQPAAPPVPRPSPVAPVKAATPPEPLKAPPVLPKPEPAAMAPAAFAGSTELETEPEIIELDATDTAMLESLSPATSAATSIATAKAPELPNAVPVAKSISSTLTPSSSQPGNTPASVPPIFDKPAAQKPAAPAGPPRPFLTPKSIGHGAAAAPAPAKEPVGTSPLDSPLSEVDSAAQIATASSASPIATHGLSSSAFTTLESPKTKSESDSGSKTPLIAVVVMVVLGVLGYFGYGYFHGKNSAATNPAVAATSPQTVPVPASAPAPASTLADATVTASPLPDASAPSAAASSALSKSSPTTAATAATPKPAATPGLIAPDKTVSLDKPAAIVVKTDSSHATPSAAPAQDQAPDAAPALAMNSGSQDKALSSIVSTAPAVPTAAPLQVINISQGVSQGLLVKKVQPNYPSQAVSLRIEGAVNLQAIIAKDGTIKEVKVLGGHPLLARAAADAVRQWRYKPYMLNGQPFEVHTEITVNFKLPN
jgi:protein TonB